MDKPEPIEAKSGDVGVLNEVLTALLERVVFVPVPADGEDLAGRLVYRDDIGKRDSGGFTVFISVFESGQVVIDHHLQKGVTRIEFHALRLTVQFVVGLLDLTRVRHWRRERDIRIEPGDLQLPDLVVGLLHQMGGAFTVGEIAGSVRNHEILCRNEVRSGSTE